MDSKDCVCNENVPCVYHSERNENAYYNLNYIEKADVKRLPQDENSNNKAWKCVIM